jgi:hypothetical protein
MKINNTFSQAGIVTVLLGSLTGCTTYVTEQREPQQVYVPAPPPQPAQVYVQPAPQPPPPAVVVIQREDDFYQPLSPYGEWVVVGSYGRCWRPARVESGWRPYANGHWELTGDGWYWVSDEPWAWATYHYGRWQLAGGYGWVWVPQTQWAPAWVSWREGGGYVGWAPLPPEPRGGVTVNVTIAPATYCFVEERRMHEPVRPTTVIVNNTTVINKTVNITKTKVVNKVVINEGPRVDQVERATGRKLQRASLAELRQKDEEPVAEKHTNLRARQDREQQPEAKQPEPSRQPEPRREIPQAKPTPERAVNQRPEREMEKPPVQRPQRETERPQREMPRPARNEPARVEPLPTVPPVNVEPKPAPVVSPKPDLQPAEIRNNRERPAREQNPPEQTPAASRNQERQLQQQERQQQQQQERLQQQQQRQQQQQEKLQQQQDRLKEQQEQRQQQRPEVQPAPRSQQERATQLGRPQNENQPRTNRAPERNARGRQPAGTNTVENPGQEAPK